MKNLFRRLDKLIMAATYLEANARKYAEECIRDLENENESQKRKGLRKQKQQRKQNQQRLRM